MITESNKVMKTLRLLGFTAAEISVYKVLVENDYLIVSEISKLANVPRTKTYEILQKLELKKVIQTIEGHPAKYRAKNPTTTLQNMRKKLIEETEEGLELLEESWNQRESIDEIRPVTVYYGSINYYKILKKMETDVKISIFILMAYIISEEEIQAIKNVIKANVKRGISVELVLHPNVKERIDTTTLKFLSENAKVLVAPIPIRVIIIDNEELILQIPTTEPLEKVTLDEIHNVIIRLSDLVKTIEKSLRTAISQVASRL